MSKILIVDDDLTLRDMYAERLKKEDFDVSIAGNGKEGIHAAEKSKPDLILLDIMMPGMNGFDTLEEMRKIPELKSIPVIMLSALIQEDNVAKAKKAGAKDYIIKSESTPAEVVERVKSHL